MRQPPPLSRLPEYPVVGGIGLLATVVTLAYKLKLADVSPLVATDHSVGEGQVWRLLGTILPHGDPIHLIFNLLWLWVLGTLVEETFGHVRTFGLVVLLAAGSMAADLAFMHGGIGLSGVGYGLFGFSWVLSSRDGRFRDAIDTQTIQLFVGWFFLCIVLTAADVLHVANVAHGAGAVLGALTGLVVAGGRRRMLYGVALAALLVAIGGAVVARPYINLTDERALARARLGYLDLGKDRNESALRHLRAALAIRDDLPSAWFNLGLANDRLGNSEAAQDAYERAVELDPTDEKYREAMEEMDARQNVDRVRRMMERIQESLGKTNADAPASTRPIDSP